LTRETTRHPAGIGSDVDLKAEAWLVRRQVKSHAATDGRAAGEAQDA
jgi:hypothetical protein